MRFTLTELRALAAQAGFTGSDIKSRQPSLWRSPKESRTHTLRPVPVERQRRRLGPGDVKSYAAWQQKPGSKGDDANGTRGKTGWDKRYVPNV